MSRTTPVPRTGGKAAPKDRSADRSPPRDAAPGGGTDKPEEAAAADTLRHRRRSDERSGSGGGDDGARNKSHWQTLRELIEHKVLVKTLLRASKAAQTNAADAARNELSVPKRALLHACAYGLLVPAALADQPMAIKAAETADRGVGWLYDRTRSAVAEGERVAHESSKQFDAAVSGGPVNAPAKADVTPGAGGAANDDKAHAASATVTKVVALLMYLGVALARGVITAVRNPTETYGAIKAGAANVLSSEQWKLRGSALVNAVRHVWSARTDSAKADAAGGSALRSAVLELIVTVALVLMPWRQMPRPVQYAH